MSVELRLARGDEVARITSVVAATYPTRCWARCTTRSRKGRRCNRPARYTVKPEGERIPYSLCKVHARMAVLEPQRVVLLAPDWDPIVERYDQRVRQSIRNARDPLGPLQ